MLCGDGHWKPLNQCILKTVCVYGSDFSKNTHFISKMTCLSGSFWRLESGFSLSMRLPVRIYISIKLLWFRSKYSLFLSWIQVLFTCKLLVSVPKSFHWKMERINKLFHLSDHETENNWFIYESSSMTNLWMVRFVHASDDTLVTESKHSLKNHQYYVNIVVY